MQRKSVSRTIACVLAVAAVGMLSTSIASARQGEDHGGADRSGRHDPFTPDFRLGPGYTATELTSDQGTGSVKNDPHLANGWGISAGPATPWWVSNQGTSTSTLYTGDGTPQALVVSVPGGPTGTVFNGGTGFPVNVAGRPVASRFIFATLAGTIEGWPTPPPVATASQTAVAAAGNAAFTGLAISSDSSELYAADFANAKVDVWNSAWAPVTTPGAFQDPYLRPSQRFAPFGIQALDGSIFVTYAKQPRTPGPELHGRGLGIVDEFSPAGVFIGRVATFGSLNAPWGLAWSPAGFGRHSNELLVGNFGDGRISAFYRLPWGQWLADDQLRTSDGHRLEIDGLWGIGFGNGAAAGPTTSLYYAAGPGAGRHGAFGSVTANP